jgi:glycosyl transferase family 2
MSTAREPAVSVVVPSVSGTAAVLECLAALSGQDDGVGAEVVVVDRSGHAMRASIREGFPAARVIAMPEGTSLPEMRGRGLAEARGRMIAVLGEHLRPGVTWLRTLAEAERSGRDAIGGPIESGGSGEGAARWAFFLSEYGPFLPPLPRAPVAVAGSNCAYARTALDRVGAREGRAVWDGDLARRLAAAGVEVEAAPGLVARNEKRLGAARLIAQRHHCARMFAAHRVLGWPLWRRVAYAAATPALPVLLLARTVATVAARRRHLEALLGALPLVVAGAVAAAVGEALGAVLGPGASAGRAE